MRVYWLGQCVVSYFFVVVVFTWSSYTAVPADSIYPLLFLFGPGETSHKVSAQACHLASFAVGMSTPLF